jgi:cyanate lyase
LLNELSSGIKIDDHLAREFDKDLHINGTAVDLLDEKSVKEFVSQLPTDKPIYRVQSV